MESARTLVKLELGGTVGDPRKCYHESQAYIRSFSLPVESIYDAWQVHSTVVVCAEVPRPLVQPHQKADAILTDKENITLFMRFADCVPILLFDPNKE